jgi:hypothetical protein
MDEDAPHGQRTALHHLWIDLAIDIASFRPDG